MNRLTYFFRITLRLALYYAIFCVACYFLADYAAFVPPPPSYDKSDDVFFLTAPNRQRVAVMHLTHPAPKATIVFAHGNGEDLGVIRFFLAEYAAQGFSVYAVDYRGYGLSDGTPSIARAKEDVALLHTYLLEEKNIPPETIILHGRSLGAACVIARAATPQVAVGGVIIESAFLSAYRVVTRIPVILGDRMNNLRRIPHISAPLLVMHGLSDRLIPAWHGKRLYAAALPPKHAFWAPNAGHNDLYFIYENTYWENVQAFVHEHIAGEAEVEVEVEVEVEAEK